MRGICGNFSRDQAGPGQVVRRGARQTRSERVAKWQCQANIAITPPPRCQYCQNTHCWQTWAELHWHSLIFDVRPLKVTQAVVWTLLFGAAKDSGTGLELIKVKKLSKSKLSKVDLFVMQQSVQGVVFLFLVLVSGEDLHDFLGLNVPFFNRDSGLSSSSNCCYCC